MLPTSTTRPWPLREHSVAGGPNPVGGVRSLSERRRNGKMNTRFQLVFSVIAAACLTGLAPAHAQVMVIGGGMARDCYHAVEYSKVASGRALQLCDEALDHETLK